MSCPNATAPINIKLKEYSICEYKCDYEFSYPSSSSLWLKNMEEYLSIKTEITADMPVLYNNNKYQVHEVRLYTPSLHSYAGEKTVSELIIHHKNERGGNDLMVCIPIIKDNSAKGESSEIFRTIFNELSKTANSKNRETVITINSFNLNKFIPLKPFHTYEGTLLYKPCNGSYDYIVFNKNNGGYIAINDKTNTMLSLLLKKNHNYVTHKVDDSFVFYNPKGPSALSKSKNNDEIYINCEPTGASGESLVPVHKYAEPALAHSASEFFSNKYVKVIVPVIIILLLVKFVGGIFGSVSSVGGAGAGTVASTSTGTSASSGGMRKK